MGNKHRRNRHRPPPQSVASRPTQSNASTPTHREVTDERATPEPPVVQQFLDRLDSTRFPQAESPVIAQSGPVSKDSETEKKTIGAQTWPGLIQHFLSGTASVGPGQCFVFALVAGAAFAGWTFVVDSGNGKLDTQEGVINFVNKAMLVMCLMCIVACLVNAVQFAKGRWSKLGWAVAACVFVVAMVALASGKVRKSLKELPEVWGSSEKAAENAKQDGQAKREK